ncbi:hypothetical protein Hamer_G031284 [Homarus americanus]|uniref:Uncharacterized protein n=1 Tax=Homarus americanus TaxID=6706 RepID=A0A8J5TSR4_HOMAM|nr:hypothetical protein Hamer_G031284 [Homarus americanus]
MTSSQVVCLIGETEALHFTPHSQSLLHSYTSQSVFPSLLHLTVSPTPHIPTQHYMSFPHSYTILKYFPHSYTSQRDLPSLLHIRVSPSLTPTPHMYNSLHYPIPIIISDVCLELLEAAHHPYLHTRLFYFSKSRIFTYMKAPIHDISVNKLCLMNIVHFFDNCPVHTARQMKRWSEERSNEIDLFDFYLNLQFHIQ